MPASSQADETALLLDAFQKYREVFVARRRLRNLAPYDHFGARNDITGEWWRYHEMLRDYGSALANEVNNLSYQVAQLSAWAEVLPPYEIEDQLVLLMEFVTPLATVAAGAPYVIRSRLIFSTSHLSHQANLITDNSYMERELPGDNKIDYRVMARVSARWPEYNALSESLGELCNERYERETSEFRNKQQHRYPPRFEHGHTGLVTRGIESCGGVSYGCGYTEPIKVANLVRELRDQHAAARRAFDCYTALVSAHLRAIYS